jgi:enoyl-CoA hydratase/carnithine racemase
MMNVWETITFEVKENGVAVLTMNRPQEMNTFNEAMPTEMKKAVAMARERDDIKVLVLTGSGSAFSAGGDINSLRGGPTTAIEAKAQYDFSTDLVIKVYELPKPVIAAVNGVVAGAATSMMMACDLIIASEKARFGFNFINIGLCPDGSNTYFLTRKVGYHKAAEILWFGDLITSAQAAQLNLVNRVVPAEELMAQAMSWADRLANAALLAIGLDKKALRQALANDFYQQAELENLNQVLAWASEDFKEGSSAFLAKRKPQFKGR